MIGMAVIVALILIAILGSSKIEQEISTNYNLEVSCESNQDCVDYIMDCISHYSDVHSWNGEIICSYGYCYCTSSD